MTEGINVIERYDDSVQRKIEQKAGKLSSKYKSNRKLDDEKLLKKVSLPRKIANYSLTVLIVVLILFSILLCISFLAGKLNKVAPTFAGYSFMQVVSPSMTATEIEIDGVKYPSGFKVGDELVVKAVDTNTLNVGDKIAYYKYSLINNEYYRHTCTEIHPDYVTPEKQVSLSLWFGFQTEDIKMAAKDNSQLIFHHIIKIYEDENGNRWFKTQGSRNSSEDSWFVSDSMVVGVYDDSSTAGAITGFLDFTTSKSGILTLTLLPLIFMVILIVKYAIENVIISKLELDIVEEKRKINDPVCQKYKVGFQMDKKTKYKVLAQAKPGERQEYLAFLWKDGGTPNSIKKYVLRKKLLLKYMTKKLELNRECEKRIKNGEDEVKVAKYYLIEKEKIELEQAKVEKRLRSLTKAYKQNKKEEKEQQNNA